MAVGLYMDHHVPRAITNALRLRGIDVLTAHEDGTHRFTDEALLDRATELRRPLFSMDDDLLAEAALRQRTGAHFSGVVFAHQLRVQIGQCVDDLALIAQAGTTADLADHVVFLPL